MIINAICECLWPWRCVPRDPRTLAQKRLDALNERVERLVDELDNGDDTQLVALWQVKRAVANARRVVWGPRGHHEYEPLMYRFGSRSSLGSGPNYEDALDEPRPRSPSPDPDEARQSVRGVISYFERNSPDGAKEAHYGEGSSK